MNTEERIAQLESDVKKLAELLAKLAEGVAQLRAAQLELIAITGKVLVARSTGGQG